MLFLYIDEESFIFNLTHILCEEPVGPSLGYPLIGQDQPTPSSYLDKKFITPSLYLNEEKFDFGSTRISYNDLGVSSSDYLL